jgi:hypothetical protein
MKKTLHNFTFALANDLVMRHRGRCDRNPRKLCRIRETQISASYALGCTPTI